jgi:hypothetical protein
VPFVTARVCEYDTLTVPDGKGVLVVMVSAGFTVIDNALVVVCELLSLTRTVKLDVSEVVGVPLIAPADDILIPSGKRPETTDHKYGPLPPVATRFEEYATPTVAEGNELVVIDNASTMLSVNILVSVCGMNRDPSFTVTVTPKSPALVGVPAICPVAGRTASPGGIPDALHVYGSVPPVAEKPDE